MTQTGTPAGVAPTTQRRGTTAGLAILAIAQFLLALDYSIVYIALPSIGEALTLAESSMQWVISGYAVFFAGFLIVGGRAADRFGPRTLFIGGMVLFGVSSLAGGLAQDTPTLLVARAVQGIAAATLQPAVISLINTSFSPGKERNRALSVWGTVGASGLASGVVIGGLLTDLSWRWVFFINLPLAIICAFAAPKLLAKGYDPARGNTALNVPSAVLCTGTVLSLAVGLTQAAAAGWTHTSTLTAFGVAALLLLLFVVQEKRSVQPLVDPLLVRTRSLLVGTGATALYMASVGNQFFVVTLQLQQLLHYGPIAAGLAFLPMAAAITVANSVAGKVVGKIGVRSSLALAFAINVVGLLLLAFQTHGESYVWNLLPGLLITGFGHGLTYVSMFIAGTHDIEDRNQGVGSAMMTTSQYMSGALGIAVLTLVLGPGPNEGAFTWAFVTTAIAAALGVLLAWFGLKREKA